MMDEQAPAFIPPNLAPDNLVPRDPAASGQATGTDDTLRLLEAALFASGQPITARAMAQLLPEWADIDALIGALQRRYAGRGIELVEVAGGWQFRTAAELAPLLRTVVEVPRRLPRAAMETLAIIAYHQPVTRLQIEELRGASLSQQTLDALLEAGLVTPAGRKEAPGRPTLWATTDAFLAQFGLASLAALPRREDLIVEPPGLRFDMPSSAEDRPPGAAAPN